MEINALNHTVSESSFWLPGFFVGMYEGNWDDAAWTTHQVTKQISDEEEEKEK